MAIYDVEVKTPLGKFSGTIEINIDGEAVTGSFSIMSFSSEFKGHSNNDNLTLTGSLMTPIGELSYDAEGSFSDIGFEGVARTRIGSFEFSPPRHKLKKKKTNKSTAL